MKLHLLIPFFVVFVMAEAPAMTFEARHNGIIYPLTIRGKGSNIFIMYQPGQPSVAPSFDMIPIHEANNSKDFYMIDYYDNLMFIPRQKPFEFEVTLGGKVVNIDPHLCYKSTLPESWFLMTKKYNAVGMTCQQVELFVKPLQTSQNKSVDSSDIIRRGLPETIKKVYIKLVI